MKLFNNPEIRIFTLVTVIPSLLLSFVLIYFSKLAAISVFCISFLLITLFLVFTRQRYKRIEKLSQSIDIILHGEESIDIRSYGEGELSVLESDVQKVLVRLRDRNDMLQKERIFLADSIADISHQLRTPLTGINLILSLLQEASISEDRRSELLRELSALISRTDYLVSVLLKISKLDAGMVKFDKKETDIAFLIKKSAEPLLVAMDIKNQKLEINAENIFLNCDISWCVEAFGNILKNCIEHTPEGGEISVDVSDTPIYTEVIITDSGNGFDEEDIPHIFDRFYKGKNSSEESFGIGLNFARMIITSHEGTIIARNNKPKGAKFIIRFFKSIV